MGEQIKELFTNFEILEKSVDNVQYNITLTWTILGIIIAVLAITASILMKTWIDKKVEKELNNKLSTELKSIIENGVNANGSYIRFPDGTQICWKKIVLSYYDKSTLSIKTIFPATFYKDEYSSTVANISLLGDSITNSKERIISYEKLDSHGMIINLDSGSGELFSPKDTAEASVIIIGRWKKYDE